MEKFPISPGPIAEKRTLRPIWPRSLCKIGCSAGASCFRSVSLRVNRSIEMLQHLLAITVDISKPPKGHRFLFFFMQLDPNHQRQFQ